MKTESGKNKMLTLVGKGVSAGLAKGKAFVYIDVLQRDSELYEIDPTQVGEELARIEEAIDNVRQGLSLDAKQIEDKLGKKSADIFLVGRINYIRIHFCWENTRKSIFFAFREAGCFHFSLFYSGLSSIY